MSFPFMSSLTTWVPFSNSEIVKRSCFLSIEIQNNSIFTRTKSMKIIQRSIESSIQEELFQGKAILLFGPRQVGKTTAVEAILAKQ